ncbi:hypothetical protein [Streptomyces sp. NPDC029526]|uniref:hypothetical protein n=1 Tax=Streptomyces sp. NPDC029526 TaxID=3155728 RepID=UPI0033F61F43
MNSRVPQPCDTPRDDHNGPVRFYVTGWRCDAHSPWAAKGLPRPDAGPGPIYAYRAADPTDDKEPTT